MAYYCRLLGFMAHESVIAFSNTVV